MERSSIRTKRWDEPAEPEDGLRILITRFRPRALPKSQETWDVWIPDLGPSKELLAAFKGKSGKPPVPWSAYKSAYLTEMRSQREKIGELAGKVASGEAITLLCASSCTDERRCHRSLLRELIEIRMNSKT